MHGALQHESAALSSGNANDIDAAIAAKNEVLQAHQTGMTVVAPQAQYQKQSKRICRTFKIVWRRSPHSAKNSTGGTARWQTINSISKLSDRTKAALNVLQGTEDMTVLYSASGVEGAAGKGSRVLGKA